ncbi:MAG: FxsA family protein [Candidatus Bipolaricaulota bacterium]|nr:MAG: FxsA family protein [Candidatus Bipolaricaulota bacterium]
MAVFALFLIIGEVFLLVAVGRAVGAAPLLGILLSTGLLGYAILRRRSVQALRTLASGFTLRGARSWPALRGDGLLLVAGFLLLLPGLATDAVGLLLLLLFAFRSRRGRVPHQHSDGAIDIEFRVHDD